jgi:hypothetical protein
MVTMPGRNDPCPCGSGRKYKQCCLQTAAEIDIRWRRLREAEGELIPDLLRFALDRWGEPYVDAAWSLFADGTVPLANAPDDREFDTTFIPWFLFDFCAGSVKRRSRRRGWPNRPAAQEYLDERRPELHDLQTRYLEAALSRPLSFFVVTAVAPGRSLDLRDVLTGRSCRVLERSASTSLEASALMLARVLSVDDVSIMLGAGAWVIPPAFHNPIIDFRESLVRSGGLLDEQTARARHVDVIRCYRNVVDELINPRMPTLVNTDGDPIAPTTVEFELRCTPGEAFDRLIPLAYGYEIDDLLADARRDGSGNVTAVTVPWAVAGNKMHRDWENTSLGTIEIDGGRMTVSVNSEQRARKIRGLLAKRLGDAASFTRQQVESIEALLDEEKKRKPSRRERAGDEALQALPEVREMMRAQSERHWAAWLDEKVPALGNLTPRETAKTPAGRERLEALLAEFAWRAKTMPSEQRPDITALRATLRLDDRLAADVTSREPSA